MAKGLRGNKGKEKEKEEGEDVQSTPSRMTRSSRKSPQEETPSSSSRKRKAVAEEDISNEEAVVQTPKRRKLQGVEGSKGTPKTPSTPRRAKKTFPVESTSSSSSLESLVEVPPVLTEEEKNQLEEKQRRMEEERLLEEQQKANVSQPVWSNFLNCLRTAEKDPEFWKRIFFLGTEVHLYPSVLEKTCDFSHLKSDLLSDKFSENDNLYLFGATEGHAFDLKVDLVPVIIVVASRLPPPEKVALTSLQQAKEEVSPFRSWHLNWAPLFVDEQPQPKGLASLKKTTHLYSLEFVQPRSSVKPSDSKIRGYQFLLPHILFPRLLDEFEPETEINFSMEIDGKVCAMEMNTDMDTPDDRAKELCEEHEISFETWGETVKQRLIVEKKALRQKNVDKKKAIETELNKYTKAELESLKSLKVYKYYPLSSPPEIRSHFVNRTYGQSEAVFPPCANFLCAKCTQSGADSEMKGLGEGEGKEGKGEESGERVEASWQCEVCTASNPGSNLRCAACAIPRSIPHGGGAGAENGMVVEG